MVADGPQQGVKFAYALNLSKCIGCRKCVHACVEENNQHRGTEERGDQIEYIRVLEMEKGSLDLEKSVHDYDHEVPAEGKYYMPVQCHHCNKAPCVKACPVEATWQEPDGIVVVDYNWCIGCRYCAAACPYWARKFNWVEPRLPTEEINPDTHYLGNRPRYKGVMEKCTFCINRVRKGLNPACHDICPTGSRKFGNLLDPGQRDPHDHRQQAHLHTEGGGGDRSELLLLLRLSAVPGGPAAYLYFRVEVGARDVHRRAAVLLVAGVPGGTDRHGRLRLLPADRRTAWA